jgi:uncharacterized membrane protein YbhN (UPF0104 family)
MLGIFRHLFIKAIKTGRNRTLEGSAQLSNVHRLLKFPPPWIKKGLALLARLGSLLVLSWMVYVTYQQRHLLLEALQFQPWYLLPAIFFYIPGFFVAVVSWRTLLDMYGEHYSFLEDYTVYASMSVYRNLPLPYVFLASVLYTYQQKGTSYKATGLVFLSTSILHIVSGIIIFSLLSLFVLPVQGHLVISVGIFASVLAAFVLHPKIFTRLISLANAQKEGVHVPHITWKKILVLVVINIFVILSAGAMTFFAASAILDLSLTLLPVCIAAFSLAISVVSFVFWLPSDFGLFQLIIVLISHPYLPVSYILALLAMMRLSNIVLDTLNLCGALFIRYVQTSKRSGE